MPVSVKCLVKLYCVLLTDTIAQRGERLELLIDKAEDLNTTVSFQWIIRNPSLLRYGTHKVSIIKSIFKV